MISYLQGTIIEKNEKDITLLTGHGVGYLIKLPQPVLQNTQIDEQLSLHIHTHVREDEISLFGFTSKEQKTLFNQLISVNGVGPKVALEILTKTPHAIKTAIYRQDVTKLSQIPGIGKKTADRIILELKNKITPPENTSEENYQNQSSEINEEAVIALINLGYNRKHVLDILKTYPDDHKQIESVIRYFLRNL